MKNRQDAHPSFQNAIEHQAGEVVDHQFTGARDFTRPADQRVVHQQQGRLALMAIPRYVRIRILELEPARVIFQVRARIVVRPAEYPWSR